MSLQSKLFEILLLVLFLTVTLFEATASLGVYSAVWFAYLISRVFFVGSPCKSPIQIVMLFLSAYVLGGYYSDLLGVSYFDVYSDVILINSYYSFVSILSAYIILMVIFIKENFSYINENYNTVVARVAGISNAKVIFVCLVFLSLGLLLWVQLIVNVGLVNLVLHGGRFAREQMSFFGNLYFQLLIIPLSIFLYYRARKEVWYRSVLIFLCIGFLWLPILMVGARQYFVLFLLPLLLFPMYTRRLMITLVCVFGAFFFDNTSGERRSWVFIG
ncbi:hypothetical protein [Piscirickettsia litoralis]|uniref:Uncharacterized protein n=1 Tax=Piscirickettsia litoralis TaxID=1891921 RepID=A0ABX3A6A1_9GAMM|nr:hypothetical protein [Piscirickettsia litoralis]ODN42970.1 hypothetical protein BGC07_08610 [Piscirickettsia litoralis]